VSTLELITLALLDADLALLVLIIFLIVT